MQVATRRLEARVAGSGARLRSAGALTLLVVGAVHLQQYFADARGEPVIGPLFLLNFAGATALAIVLLVPRLRALPVLAAIGGIGISLTSIVFLLVAEHQPLFGMKESGYDGTVFLALVAEGVTAALLAAYLVQNQPKRYRPRHGRRGRA